MRRERRRRRNRSEVVVFLDANISGWVAQYLANLRSCAHWVSFWEPHGFVRNGGSKKRFYSSHTIKRWKWFKRNFYDSTGDENILDAKGIHPSHMKDDDLITYIVRLVTERYPDRGLYIFYTHDKRFLTQKIIQNHPSLPCFLEDGVIVYVPLDTPHSGRVVADTAQKVRNDFENRISQLDS